MNDYDKELLHDLASRYIDDGLSSEELNRLSNILKERSAQEDFLRLAITNSELQLLLSEAPLSKTSDSFHDLARINPSSANTLTAVLRYGAVAIAASLLTSFAAYSWSILHSSDTPTNTASNSSFTESDLVPGNDATASKPDQVVARIVRKIDCDWESDRWGMVSTPELRAGKSLTLTGGLMELEFTSGARVTLEAPVSFQIESPMKGSLSYGKLTAQIPKSAHGFTVSTPQGDTIDLGTEFGILVAEDGATETHVFGGEVIVRPDVTKPDNEEVRLLDDMALRLASNQQASNHISAVPNRFTQINFEKPVVNSKPPVDRHLAIWYSADQRVQLDEYGRVSSWGDLLTESNSTEHNAWQIDEPKRPLLVKDTIAGQPALRFKGRQFLITEPLPIGTAQTLVAVFQANLSSMDQLGTNKEVGRQIANLNGPPHLVLSINDSKRLVSRMYVGDVLTPMEQRDYLIAGKMISEDPIGSEPIVVMTVYDPGTKSSRLYVNGSLVDTAGAREMKSTNTPRYIGTHRLLGNTQFVGDLAELMLYDVGLSDDEAMTVSKTLMEKYDINLASD